MYLPNNFAIVGSLPITGVDLSLHTFLGVSWHVLLPYTLTGIALMIYSHARLANGQRDLRRQAKLDAADTTSL